MGFENWDEVRTAYQVARIGTVSGAAEVLGVHHATVIRHIDALEQRLGTRLFQRHARGYTPTEAGSELLKVAQTTEEQFAQLANKINGVGSDMAGELIVTSVPGLSALITPTIARLQQRHPDLAVRYLTDPRVLRLEYGEAHVAIRAGARPQEPDNVVQPFTNVRMALYASRGYAEMHGLPRSEADMGNHRFVGMGHDGLESRAPYFRWLASHVPQEQVMFRTNDNEVYVDAVRDGLGLGFLPVLPGRDRAALTEALLSLDEWLIHLWLVTHIDLHRTPKIQAVLAALKEDARALDAA
jgi:DNA-binding transcriptional LysR family regulator